MSPVKKKTLLLVEDEFFIARMEMQQLENEGYRVIHVSSGEKALEMIFEKKEQLDLILMDIDLGKGIDGTETARRILKILHIPIVFLTSHSEKEMVDRVKGITRYGYVIKNSGDFVLLSSIEMAFELFDAYLQKKNSEEKYRLLFMSNPVPMWVYDSETLKFLAVNDFAVESYGYSREEFLGMTIKEIRPQEQLPNLYKALQENVGFIRKHIYAIHQKKDGSVIQVMIDAHEIDFEGRKGVLVLASDITEMVHIKSSLAEIEEKYRELTEPTRENS